MGGSPRYSAMCNLYALTSSQQAIRDLTRALRDLAGNLPAMPEIYPDQTAPIIRQGSDGVRELARARWGMPSPAFALEGRRVDRGVTNIRNAGSPHWRRWLGPANRCVVPFDAFSEPGRTPEGNHRPVWFALGPDRPIGFFAGVWTGWTSVRKLAEGAVTCDLFGFLTTEPNREVGAVHPKAMPVILTEAAELDAWLEAPWEEARRLQRPLPDGRLNEMAPPLPAAPAAQASLF